jgi:hypothetical protein
LHLFHARLADVAHIQWWKRCLIDICLRIPCRQAVQPLAYLSRGQGGAAASAIAANPLILRESNKDRPTGREGFGAPLPELDDFVQSDLPRAR